MGKAFPEPRREEVVGKIVGETTIVQNVLRDLPRRGSWSRFSNHMWIVLDVGLEGV